MNSRFLILFLMLILNESLQAQVTIQGNIKNKENKPLSRINILIYKPHTKLLLNFAVSDENGNFQTSVDVDIDSLDIEISAIHYENINRRIPNQNQKLLFEMAVGVAKLEGVTIKAKPITRQGDTLSYLVTAFARNEDRVIEDVLKNMPGIEVMPDGKILYEGLPLKKFYVEGLDLMDGRYTAISKNLPVSAVSTVEILENHQPIRILEKRISVQQASLNLKLKRDVSLTGTGNVDAGLSPFLWDVNLTPMLFTKKYQMLTSYQTNNTGKDVSRQIEVNTIDELLINADQPVEDPGILNIQSANEPGISENRYLDNRVHLLNLNGLQRLNNELQFRSNVFYVNDNQEQQAQLNRKLFTPQDTLEFIEKFDNRFQKNLLFGQFTITRNVEKNYLNNELNFKRRWNKHSGLVVSNNAAVDQSLETPLVAVSNDFHSVRPVGKRLLDIRLFASYNQHSQKLIVSPGQFEELLNQGEPYESTIQKIDLKRFYTNYAMGMVYSWKRLVIKPEAGFAIRWQNLKSNITVEEEDQVFQPGTDFRNNLSGLQTTAFLKTGFEYQKKKLTLKIQIPLSWQFLDLKDIEPGKEQTYSHILFDPSLSINYKLTNFWKIRSRWSLATTPGNIDRIYYGYILRNYRNLSLNAIPLEVISRQHFSGGIYYKNPITSLFGSILFTYSVSENNMLYANNVLPDGTNILLAKEIPNSVSSHNFQLRSSKFFSGSKTTLSLKTSYNSRKGKSLVNDELFIATSRFLLLNPELNIRFTQWLNFDYGLETTILETFIENDRKRRIILHRHKSNVFLFLSENHLLRFSAEYYTLRKNDHFFIDFNYRYSISEKGIDMEFRWINILNQNTYTSYQASGFTVWESVYILRPSQFLVSVNFSF